MSKSEILIIKQDKQNKRDVVNDQIFLLDECEDIRSSLIFLNLT